MSTLLLFLLLVMWLVALGRAAQPSEMRAPWSRLGFRESAALIAAGLACLWRAGGADSTG